jgi:predicted flap endonuclease-1-like 5' DNA nuclease
MPRWLTRLLILGLIAAVVAFVISRLMGQEEDFDEFEDIESGLEFQETPVEIEVPAGEGTPAQAATTQTPDSGERTNTITTPISPEQIPAVAEAGEAPEATGAPALTDISGVGPAFEARLRAAGISSVQELANADAGTLAEQVDISVERAEDWIDQARQLVSQGQQADSGSGGAGQ